jgi:signal transduction histidine kinase
MMQSGKSVSGRSGKPFQSMAASLIPILSRHNTVILIFAVCCGVGIVSLLVLRDLRSATSQSSKLYTRSVDGLKRISEMQYAVQETRRCILYALTTGDSNLQVRYADESRDADQGVKTRIADLKDHASTVPESTLASRLGFDWASYLSVRDEEIALILEGSTSEAVAMDLSRGVPSFERVRKDLLEVQRMYDADARDGEEHLAFWSQRSSARLIGMLSFTFLISTVAVIGIQRSRVINAIQLNRVQMEFVASMSHELRTPLAVMGSAADNLADGVVADKESVRRYGGILQRQNRAMSDLVDKMLLFAATEDKHLNHVLEPLSIETILTAAVKRFAGSGFTIETAIEPNLSPVLANNIGLSHCLQSLIDNAIKYSNGVRKIQLHAFRGAAAPGTAKEVSISVIDQGIGIHDSELPLIWDPFYRSPRVRNAQIHGTGLGLALTKRIAESMGARLSVMSSVNQGTTFTLHLRAASVEDQVFERPDLPLEVPHG